jgi:hypothetical protein
MGLLFIPEAECGEPGQKDVDGGNEELRVKHVLVPLCPPQTPKCHLIVE